MADGAASLPANPAPLGLAGFGLTTVVLSSINAGLLTGDGPTLGILEYKNNNTFGTVAFTSYGLFWWWYAFLLWTSGAGWIKAPAANAVGVTLLMWGVFTLYMWIPTFRLNFCLWTVFLLLWITFFLLAGGDLGMGVAWRHAGGWLGLATGIDALYLSFAEVTNATARKTVLPVGGPILKG